MVYLFLANGFEQSEALVPLDILRRAGVDVKTVGINGNEATSTHNVTVKTDISCDEIKLDSELEGVILPGGMPGANNLDANTNVKNAVKFANDNNKLIAAICAAPLVLGHAGVLQGKNAVCYPGFEKELFGAKVQNESVCVSDNVITAKGAGVSLEFGLELAKYLKGEKKSRDIAEAIQCPK